MDRFKGFATAKSDGEFYICPLIVLYSSSEARHRYSMSTRWMDIQWDSYNLSQGGKYKIVGVSESTPKLSVICHCEGYIVQRTSGHTRQY